ncbi:MAG: hypothetical protein AAF383_20895 [Cyanobacteria bacterium P01_A01_bin.83]
MTSSEDFKQAIREGNISEAFLVAMSNAPQLNITTKIITADGHHVDASPSQLDNYLHTHINLIEGKVENEIGEQLTGDRYSEIKQFHLEQVTHGHQTIQDNLVSLQKMFQLMSAFEQQHLNHANWVDIAADVTRETLTAKPDPTQLYAGKVANALEAGITTDPADTAIPQDNSALEENPEPQLPSFEDEDDGVVDDLLSIADIDDDIEEINYPEESETTNQGDWSQWLDDEPEEVKPEVFDLKSLNIRQDSEKWQNWSPHHDQANTQPPQDES